MTNARTSSRRPSSHLISGITRSMPSISSRGNSTPQSSTTILPRYSTAVMFLPISPRPPRGMILRESFMRRQSYSLATRKGEPARRGGRSGSCPAQHAQPPQLVGDGGGFLGGSGHQREAQTAHLVPQQVEGFFDEDGVGGQKQRIVESAEAFVEPLRPGHVVGPQLAEMARLTRAGDVAG